MAKNNSDGDLTDLADSESQITPNDNDNTSSSNSMLGSIFSTGKKVAMFGFNTAYDVGNAVIGTVRGNNGGGNDDSGDNSGGSNNINNNNDNNNINNAVVATKVEEPTVLTAIRVESDVQIYDGSEQRNNNNRVLQRQQSWVDERRNRLEARRQNNNEPIPRDEAAAVYLLFLFLVGLIGFIIYGFVIVIQDMINGDKLDQYNLLPNTLAFMILVLFESCSFCSAIVKIGKDGGKDDSGGVLPMFICLWIISFVYGWILVSLVSSSGNPAVCDPTIYSHVLIVVVTIQVLNSLAIIGVILYAIAVFFVMFMITACCDAFTMCWRRS